MFEVHQVQKALLLAADHIEANPSQFDIFHVTVPSIGIGSGWDSRGCVVGWVAYFLGMKPGSNIGELDSTDQESGSRQIFGVSEATFFGRLNAQAGSEYWRMRAKAAAEVMRKYAQVYLEDTRAEWMKMQDREAEQRQRTYEKFRKTLNLTPIKEEDHACVSSRDHKAHSAGKAHHPRWHITASTATCVAPAFLGGGTDHGSADGGHGAGGQGDRRPEPVRRSPALA